MILKVLQKSTDYGWMSCVIGRNSKLLKIGVFCAWSASVAFGMASMMGFESRAGLPGDPPISWPLESALHHSSDFSTLVMFLHPACSCSRASMEELKRLLNESSPAVGSYLVVAIPEGMSKQDMDVTLESAIADLHNVSIFYDFSGNESKRFRVRTSGHTLLYDRNGTLLFSGGITAGRGKSGANAAEARLRSLILGNTDVALSSPVFGCNLSRESDGIK